MTKIMPPCAILLLACVLKHFSLWFSAMKHTAAISGHLNELLDGATDPDPNQHGLTTDEEKSSSSVPIWPGVDRHVPVANSELRLYGGAAFERCMEEFQSISSALSFPSGAPSQDQQFLQQIICLLYITITIIGMPNHPIYLLHIKHPITFLLTQITCGSPIMLSCCLTIQFLIPKYQIQVS